MSKKVFLDCGAHQGESVEKFLEYFPDADSFEIHCFEPNPRFRFLLESLRGVVFHGQAVWIQDGDVSYFGMDEPSRSAGYTIVREKNDISHEQPIPVECLDLSSWIARNFCSDDLIILKLDVEGAEYRILEKMIDTGTIELIDRLYIEFHLPWMDIDPGTHDAVLEKLKARGLEPRFWDALDGTFVPA